MENNIDFEKKLLKYGFDINNTHKFEYYYHRLWKRASVLEFELSQGNITPIESHEKEEIDSLLSLLKLKEI